MYIAKASASLNYNQSLCYIFTARIRRMGEGTVFSLSVHISGGYWTTISHYITFFSKSYRNCFPLQALDTIYYQGVVELIWVSWSERGGNLSIITSFALIPRATFQIFQFLMHSKQPVKMRANFFPWHWQKCQIVRYNNRLETSSFFCTFFTHCR